MEQRDRVQDPGGVAGRDVGALGDVRADRKELDPAVQEALQKGDKAGAKKAMEKMMAKMVPVQEQGRFVEAFRAAYSNNVSWCKSLVENGIPRSSQAG